MTTTNSTQFNDLYKNIKDLLKEYSHIDKVNLIEYIQYKFITEKPNKKQSHFVDEVFGNDWNKIVDDARNSKYFLSYDSYGYLEDVKNVLHAILFENYKQLAYEINESVFINSLNKENKKILINAIKRVYHELEDKIFYENYDLLDEEIVEEVKKEDILLRDFTSFLITKFNN